jgi:hypothetical protein
MSKDASSLSQSIVPAQYRPTMQRFGEYAIASAKIRQLTSIIRSGMRIGADGVHIGTVDKIETGRIKLTKKDGGEGSHKAHHHFIDKGLVADVSGDKVRLSANANVAVTMEEEK